MTSNLRMLSVAFVATAVLGTAVLTTPVFAQTSGTNASAPATTITPAKPVRGRQKAASVEEWIQDLHAKLKITAAQEPQWGAVAQVMRDNAAALNTLVRTRSQNAKSMNAVDDLRSYEEIAAAHEVGLQKLIPVFQTLYEQMSDPQKKTVDAVFQQQKRVARG